MLGRPPEKERGKLKRKWEEGSGSGDEKPDVTENDVEEWRQREKVEEHHQAEEQKVQETPAGEESETLAAAAMPPPPGTVPITGSMRFGEGDDSGRSADEIRIIKEMLAAEMERFLQEHRIEPPVARDMRNELPSVQFAVLDRGTLVNCTNPSGALMARIRDAKKGVLVSRSGANPPTGAIGSVAPMPPPPSMLSSMPGVAMVMPQRVIDIDKFAAENQLDHASVMALKAEPKEVQEKVVLRGAFVGTTNTSASLMGRIRAVKNGGGGGGMMAPHQPPPGAPVPQHLIAPPPPPPAIDSGVLNQEALKAAERLMMKTGEGLM